MIVDRLAMDRSWRWTLPLLLVGFGLIELTEIDLWLQDRFYDFGTGRWLVEARDFWPRVLFYSGPKYVLVTGALLLIGLALGPLRWRRRWLAPAVRRRDLWVVIATLATGPALISAGKATTNVFCPYEIQRYGGDVAYMKVCAVYPAGERPARRGRGFPAGHASGGFALVALAGLASTRRGRWIGLGIGLAAGWAMGLYQMAKGAHYLSHTVVTMGVLWLVFLVWRRVLGAAEGDRPRVGD